MDITKALQEILWQMNKTLLKFGEETFLEFIDDNDLSHFETTKDLGTYDPFLLFRYFCSKLMNYKLLEKSWVISGDYYRISLNEEWLSSPKELVEEFCQNNG